MRADAAPASVALAAWREQGADRVDPLRFHFIEALAARALAHDGEARRLLDARLERLVAAYAKDVAAAAAGPAPRDAGGAPAPGPLAGLLEHLAARAAAKPAGPDREQETATHAGHAAQRPAALDEARSLWTEVRTESQLRHSLAHVDDDAGPLNSGVLVHRALTFMRTASPGYLRHFLAYADALAWLDQAHGDAMPAATEAPRADGKARRTRPGGGRRRRG